MHYCRGALDTLKYSIMLADRVVSFEVGKSREQGKHQYFLRNDSLSRALRPINKHLVSVFLGVVPFKGSSYSGRMAIAYGRGTWLLALLR